MGYSSTDLKRPPPLKKKNTTKSEKASSSMIIPSRSSSRLHEVPIIRNLGEMEDYALDKLGIDRGLWESAASYICGGDLKKLLQIICYDYGVKTFMFNCPRQFKLFFETQLPYWLGKQQQQQLPSSSSSSSKNDEVNGSSVVFIFSYIGSLNRLRVYSIPPPSISLLKTLENVPHHRWPACVTLASFVYFIGGLCKFGDKLYSSKMMFAFNVADLNNKDPPPLLKLPNMNFGKSNPLALAAMGKIYVLSLPIRELLDKPALSKLEFNFTPDYRAWTLLDEAYQADWYCGAFEVYDPSTCDWTILPLPFTNLPLSDSSPLTFGLTVHHFSETVGYAVIRDRLFFYSHFMGARVYTFDIRTLRWKSYDEITRADAEPQDYYDSLAYQLLDNGMYGRGLLVNDTFYAFSSNDIVDEKDLSVHFGIWAYRLPNSLDEKICHSGPLTGFSIDDVLGPSLSMRLQACVVFLGDGTFGCVHVKQIKKVVSYGDRFPKLKDWVYIPPEYRPCFTTFNVHEVEGNDGKRSWHADSLVEYELSGLTPDSGEEFLACYAR